MKYFNYLSSLYPTKIWNYLTVSKKKSAIAGGLTAAFWTGLYYYNELVNPVLDEFNRFEIDRFGRMRADDQLFPIPIVSPGRSGEYPLQLPFRYLTPIDKVIYWIFSDPFHTVLVAVALPFVVGGTYFGLNKLYGRFKKDKKQRFKKISNQETVINSAKL